MELGAQDRRGEMQGLEIGPRWGSRMVVKVMGLTRDVLIRVGMLVAALNSRQEDVHEEKRSPDETKVLGFCRYLLPTEEGLGLQVGNRGNVLHGLE